MPLIILGVLILGGLFALIEIMGNRKRGSASSNGKADKAAPVIYLPTDIEREKKKRHII
ncbi:hypothetical protein NE619_10045 [Anaerovorax odorimutans]|uniref:DUF3951 domain-containing protein n=1 Tax=Anaerovorax odorimutans TaxID=109327 RepID=A0ABT1RPE7_9FIRM|nr:hypothetical protein [Anaerovorax odorimutans]MCQ4637067.1 hypothetical protein [Anaerovorax odorimutans]